MQIFLKTLTGKTLTFVVKPNELILSLKKQIENRQGIPWVIQRIDYGGKLLENDSTFSFYKIQKEATLFLTAPINHHIIIQIDDKDYINQCWTRPSNANTYTISKLKQEICKTLNINISTQDFYTKYILIPRDNNESLNNNLKIWTKEANQIWNENHLTLILHLKQINTLQWYNQTKDSINNITNDDNKCDTTDNQTTQQITTAQKKRFSIQIVLSQKMNNKNTFEDLGKILLAIPSNVTISYFIQTAKKKIDKKYGKKYDFSYEEQTGLQIYVRSKQDKDIKQMKTKWYEIIDLDEPMEDYVINTNDEVVVFIFAVTNAINIKDDDKEEEEDESEEEKEEENPKSTELTDEEKAKLNALKEVMEEMEIEITVQTVFGNSYKINGIGLHDTVKTLKIGIADKCGISKAAQKLSWQGDVLENDKSLAYYKGFKQKPIVNLVEIQLSKISLFVKTLTGKTIELEEIDKNATVLDLKNKVHEEEGVPPQIQRLISKGRQMEDFRMISDYNLQHQDVLHMVFISRRLGDGLMNNDLLFDGYVGDGNDDDNMTLHVKTLIGTIIVIDDICVGDTVEILKNKVMEKEGIPVEKQRLIRRGFMMDDEKRLSEYGIEDQDDGINLVLKI